MDTPCRLYLDLEYSKSFNFYTENENMKILNEVFQLIIGLVKDFLDEEISEKSFLILDSSTSEKFSKHVIVHSKKLFPNNTCLKDFIENLCSKMKHENVGIVMSGPLEEDFIVDRSVYSKNRCFRLYKSSKYSKKQTLEFDRTCLFYEGMKAFLNF